MSHATRLALLTAAALTVAAGAPAAAPAATQRTLFVTTKAGGGVAHWEARSNGRRGPRIPCAKKVVLPSPDGSQVLCGAGASWRIVTLATGRSVTVAAPTGQRLVDFTWSPDSRALLASIDASGTGRLALVNALSGTLATIRTLADGAGVGGMAWAPDSRNAVYVERTADAQARSAHVIDVATSADRPLVALPGVSAAQPVDWSSRGEIAAVDGAGRIQVLRPDGTALATLGRASERAASVAWAPNGARLAVNAGAKRWRIVARSGAVTVARIQPQGPLAWAPDSKRLAAATAKGVSIVDTRGRVVRRFGAFKRAQRVTWATPRSAL